MVVSTPTLLLWERPPPARAERVKAREATAECGPGLDALEQAGTLVVSRASTYLAPGRAPRVSRSCSRFAFRVRVRVWHPGSLRRHARPSRPHARSRRARTQPRPGPARPSRSHARSHRARTQPRLAHARPSRGHAPSRRAGTRPRRGRAALSRARALTPCSRAASPGHARPSRGHARSRRARARPRTGHARPSRAREGTRSLL
jgi:hypothetical protein